jgi:predicted alpha/beta superfamily hydrolase
MRPSFFKILFFIIAFSAAAQNESKLVKIDNFRSQFVKERNIEIWLPKAYFDNKAQSFPVVYMHNGQNVFNASTSTSGTALDADVTANKLITDETVSPFIIVAIWGTEKQFLEYFPEEAADHFSGQDIDEIEEAWKIKNIKRDDFLGDEYLQFITAELKPYIDKNYRTLKSPEHTAIAGTSMGGLISLYAICEYPDIFGQAACISTHWPVLFDNGNMNPSDAVKKYLEENLPEPQGHRIYFDHGTHTLDQYYGVHQQMVDRLMQAKGYSEGNNWVTIRFEGAEHHEKSIKERMDAIFKFLFPLKKD